jgi:hypothetical protein
MYATSDRNRHRIFQLEFSSLGNFVVQFGNFVAQFGNFLYRICTKWCKVDPIMRYWKNAHPAKGRQSERALRFGQRFHGSEQVVQPSWACWEQLRSLSMNKSDLYLWKLYHTCTEAKFSHLGGSFMCVDAHNGWGALPCWQQFSHWFISVSCYSQWIQYIPWLFRSSFLHHDFCWPCTQSRQVGSLIQH